MAIRLVPDVAVPAGVFVADWATSAYDEKATGMKLNRPVGIGLAVLGYAGAMLGWGGDAVKNIGIASFDWAANSVVSYIKERGGTPASSRVERIPVRARFSESKTVYPTPGEEVQVTVT
jgi:hypothetical protein